jgi:hypothetical protein
MAFSNTTIPVCFSCVPRASGCCTFQTALCLPPEPQTLEELLAIDPFAQILLVMCEHSFLWNPCSGPFGEGFTEAGLLVELQQAFPESDWTEETLAPFLSVGIQQGILKRSSGETEVTYYANQNLLNVNPRNWRYEIVCPQFCAKKACKLPTSLKFY